MLLEVGGQEVDTAYIVSRSSQWVCFMERPRGCIIYKDYEE